MDKAQNRIPDFFEKVDVLLRAAFEAPDEADLVKQLRHDEDMADEIVLKDGQGVIGYAALSHMVSPTGWFCLAPVAVDPALQRLGHGKAVLAMVVNWAKERNAMVVVLGDPNFYGANGFSTDRAARLKTPYPVEFTLLAGPGDDAPAETLIYPAAFCELD